MTEQRSVAVRLQDELAVARHNGARAMKDLYTAVSADLGDSQAALAEATRRADRTEREVARLTRQRNRLRGRLRRSRTRVRRLRRRAIRAQEQAATWRAEITTLRASRAFRLGRTVVTGPARLRDRLRR